MSEQSQNTGDGFTFHCACGRKLKAQISMAGKLAICPKCKKQFRIPGPTEAKTGLQVAENQSDKSTTRYGALPHPLEPRADVTSSPAKDQDKYQAHFPGDIPPFSSNLMSQEKHEENTSDVKRKKQKKVIILVGVAVMLFVVGVTLGMLLLLGGEKSVEEIIKESSKAVVVVTTKNGMGSGFVLSEDGIIVTNSHVIEGSSEDEIKVHMISSDGQVTTTKTIEKVSVLLDDPDKDIAILKVGQSGLPSLALAERELKTGEKVIAIGNPAPGGEILANTASEGIVSNPARNIEGGVYIQTTAAVNPGNSGGPLLNIKGEVIGMVTLKAGSSEGIAFAIPAAEIKKVLEEYKNMKPEDIAQRELLKCCNDMAALEKDASMVLDYYRKVWYAAIFVYETHDFNKDLAEAVKKMKPLVGTLKKRHASVRSRVRELGNNSGRAYDELINAFAVLSEMMELVETPTGSLQSFTEKIRSLHSNFTQAKTKVETLAP